jgi:hypothetical protein
MILAKDCAHAGAGANDTQFVPCCRAWRLSAQHRQEVWCVQTGSTPFKEHLPLPRNLVATSRSSQRCCDTPTHMLSYSWSYSVVMIVDALREFEHEERMNVVVVVLRIAKKKTPTQICEVQTTSAPQNCLPDIWGTRILHSSVVRPLGCMINT